MSDSTLTLIGSSGALFSATFTVFVASSLDKYKIKPIILTVLLTIATTLILIMTSFSDYPLVYGLCICLNVACDGSLMAMLPAITMSIFGLRRGPAVYGYLFSIFGMAAMISLVLV